MRAVDALLHNPEAPFSRLIVFSDAAKTAKDADKVTEVRKFLRTIQGFLDVQIVEHITNRGVDRAEIEGITSVINSYGRAIILEDDILVGPQFLNYMNLALEKYEFEKKVFSITGYSFIGPDKVPNDTVPEFSFIPLTSAWGWGTWKDRWDYLKLSISKREMSLLKDKNKSNRFDFGYHYSDMLLGQYARQNYTWDLLWYWTSFIHGGLTLAPIHTMVNNIGMDGTGVHYIFRKSTNRVEDLKQNYKMEFPAHIEENEWVSHAIRKELAASSQISTIANIKKWIRRVKYLYMFA